MTLQDLGFTSWVPLVVTLAIGFILGWLITGISPRRKLSRVTSDAQDLDARLNQANKTLAASQAHEKELQSGVDATKVSLGEATARVAALQQENAAAHQHEQELQTALDAARNDLDQINAQVNALQQTLDARDGELTELKMQHSSLRTTAQQSYEGFTTQVESLQVEVKRLCDDNENLHVNLEGTAGDLAKARTDLETLQQTLANKDTALTEAYARAVRLQHESADEHSQLLSLQSEVASLKRNLSTLAATNQDLNGRLENARGEVANELAVLTSTMLRVKEEQLTQANATIAALQAELAVTAGRPIPS
jgi:chromosome segregation ATPase